MLKGDNYLNFSACSGAVGAASLPDMPIVEPLDQQPPRIIPQPRGPYRRLASIVSLDELTPPPHMRRGVGEVREPDKTVDFRLEVATAMQ